MDTFLIINEMPVIGETIAAKSVKKAFGGKVSIPSKHVINHPNTAPRLNPFRFAYLQGANQAVAA
jgi:hypothetical protein